MTQPPPLPLPKRHLILRRRVEDAYNRLEHAQRCIYDMEQLKGQSWELNLNDPNPDRPLLALWHEAVNSAVSVHALIGLDAKIRGTYGGLDDDSARAFAQRRGWPDHQNFLDWRVQRHLIQHVLKWDVVNYPMHHVLPYVDRYPKYDIPKTYIGPADNYNFDALPDEDTLKRFEQYTHGLYNALRDWEKVERARADQSAKQTTGDVKQRDVVVSRSMHCPTRLVETLLTQLSDEVSCGRASSIRMGEYRYYIESAVRDSGALKARCLLDHFNADLSSRELALSRWSRYVEARLEALDVWMKEAGGGSMSKVMQYTPDRDRYFDILADVCAKHRVRP